MAGDWIKVRTSLPRDGRILIASRKCHAENVTPVTMVGAVVTLWSHADAHADENGVLVGYKVEDIDALVGITGFCAAMPPDWMAFTAEGWVQLPEWEAHNGESAKARALAQKRKKLQRARDNLVTEVTEMSRPPRDSGHKNVTPREEKRRDTTPVVPKGTFSPEELAALTRVREFFRIRPSTPLDERQSNTWKKNRGAVLATSEDEWRLLAWWYKQPGGEGDIAQYRKTTFTFLLNAWADEIAKARRAAENEGVTFGETKKEGPRIPENWQALLSEADPEMPLPDRFESLPASVRSWVYELEAAEKRRAA